jgi:hypothetical protein
VALNPHLPLALCCFAKSFARKQPHDVDWYDTRMSSEEAADGGSNRRRLRFAKRSQSTYEPRVTLQSPKKSPTATTTTKVLPPLSLLTSLLPTAPQFHADQGPLISHSLEYHC